ncbi:MAG: hypothetical protein EBQ73_02915, partial [Gammaproteobacteria bacterium]|nr:hypothetical protein [Gammaproteobacteria bacterium]
MNIRAILKHLQAVLILMSFSFILPTEGFPLAIHGAPYKGPSLKAHTEPVKLLGDPGAALGSRRIDLEPLSATAARAQSVGDPGGPIKIGFMRDVPVVDDPIETQRRLYWMALPSGEWVGQLAIRSPGARALRMGIKASLIPAGADVRFFGYDASEIQEVSGKAISETIAVNLEAGDAEEVAGIYWSPVILGETIGIEIVLPNGTPLDSVVISTPIISHLFVEPSSDLAASLPRAAAACNLDVMCYPNWSTTTSNAVGQMVYTKPEGTFVCTGTLLNDIDVTFTPYFLTANHCISNQSTASSLQTWWFYHASSCNSGVPYYGRQTIYPGATLLYNSATTDTSFLRLNYPPPGGVYYAGWTASTPLFGQAATGLHNPQGDLQKISFGSFNKFQICVAAGVSNFTCSVADASTGTFLEIDYTQGMTEGGSSGSAVFNKDGQVYGQLYGGTISCSNPSGTTSYGRFDLAFNQGNLGQWLMKSTKPQMMTVTVTGGGRVTSQPQGIDCPSSCSAQFIAGTQVVLTSLPKEGYSFSGWSGDCSGGGSCSLTLDSQKTIGAVFVANKILTANKIGNGTLSSTPSGILCGTACQSAFTLGTTVNLTAAPDAGWSFLGWSGACSGAGGCSVVLDQDKTVTGQFALLPRYLLRVAYPSNGSITSSSTEIKCGGGNRACEALVAQTLLTATPQGGYAFKAWSGCPKPVGNTCQLSLVRPLSLRATFVALPKYSLFLSKNKFGSVLSNPPGLNCSPQTYSCRARFNVGTSVTLTALPLVGRQFVGWSGACSGSGPCTFVFNGPSYV